MIRTTRLSRARPLSLCTPPTTAVEAIRQKASLEPDIIAVIQQEEAQVLNEALRRRVLEAAPRAADGPEPGPGPQAAARAEPEAEGGAARGKEEGGAAGLEDSGE